MDILKKFKEWQRKRHKRDIEEYANNAFQICEHNGSLWFTHAGQVICPMSMFNDTPTDVVIKIRAMYITNQNMKYDE